MKKCVNRIADGTLCGQPVANGGNKHPIDLSSCRTPRQKKMEKQARIQIGDMAAVCRTQDRIHKVAASSKADRKTKPIPGKAA